MLGRLQNYAVWVVLILAIGALYTRFSDRIFIGNGKVVVEQKGENGKPLIVLWRGKVAPPMGEKIMQAVSEHGRSTDRIILKLDSPGGLTSYGARVIRQINSLKGRYRVDTHVEGGDRCLSMCVAIYLQGQTRFASPGARFMFHEVSSFDVVSDERVPMSRRETQVKTDRLYLRYFAEAEGVSRPWLLNLRKEMQGRDVWRSGQQLVSEKSGIVQQLI